ncbi:MAG: LysE family transporter [Myxococcota bacterium]
MTIGAWLFFVATESVLCLSPGPAVLTVVSQGVSYGFRSGVWTSVGVLSANVLYFGVSATGLFAVAVAWVELFFLIKWVGAAYLIWLGVQMWRTASMDPVGNQGPPESQRAATAGRALLRGFVVQLSNPKTLLYFGALLPQFIDARREVGMQIAILGATSIVVEFAILTGYATLGARAARYAQTSRWVGRIGGSLLIGAGAGLAALRRS